MDFVEINDKKSIEQFKDLLDQESFRIAVRNARLELGFSDKGYIGTKHSNEPYGYKTGPEIDRKVVKKIMKKFKMKKNLEVFLTMYLEDDSLKLLKRKNQNSNPIVMNFDAYGVSLGWEQLSKNGQPAILKITAGVTKSDVTRFIEDWFWFIDGQLKKHHPEEYKKGRIRTKQHRDRNKQIVYLYEQGIFKTDGHFNIKTLKQFLQSQGVEIDERSVNHKQLLQGLGYEIPTQDAIRKIIQQHKRNQ